MKWLLVFLCFSSLLFSQNIYFSEPTSSHVDYVNLDGEAGIAYRMYAANGFYIHWYQAKLTRPNQTQTPWQTGQTGGWYESKAGTYKIQGQALGTYVPLGITDSLFRAPFSFSVVDNYSPSAPSNLSYISSNNHPKIQWSANDEKDLQGYKIYKKLGATFNWTYLASTSNAYYIDSSEDLSGVGSHSVWYKVKAYDINGNISNYSSELEVEVAGNALDKKNAENTEVDFQLFNNYPNPFNPTTQISFSIPKASNVTLRVFNTIGEVVAELVDNNLESGHHSVTFNSENLPSGLYIYELTAGNLTDFKKMLLVK